MRFSLKQKIYAALLSLCTLLLCGCSVTSILDPDEVYNMDHSDGERTPWKNKDNLVYHDVYAKGDRAFYFENCDDASQLVDFQYIGLLGDTFIYYYSVKKGSRLFYTVAAYNFKTSAYRTIIKKDYDESNSKFINCNHFLLSKNMQASGAVSSATYFINVGYSFYKVVMASGDGVDFFSDQVEEWEIDDGMLLYIKSQFTQNLSEASDVDVMVSDVAPWSNEGKIYSVAFVSVPADSTNVPETFVEQIILMQIQLNKNILPDESNTVVRTVSAAVQEKDIKSTTAGSVLSTDTDSKDCIFIKSIGGTKITFGKCVKNASTATNTYFDVNKKATDKLITFSVVNDGSSTNENILQLVYLNRLEYWRTGIDFTDSQSLKNGATLLASFPLKDAGSYWVSDSTPSIHYDKQANSVMLASNKHGVKTLTNNPVYDSDGETVLRYDTTEQKIDTEFSTYLIEPYGDDLLLVGFDGLKFNRVTDCVDADGTVVKTKQSKEYYSLAQLPFATVRIKTLFPDGTYNIPKENLANKDTYAKGQRAFMFPIIDENTQTTNTGNGFVKITNIQNEYENVSDFSYIGIQGDTLLYCFSATDEDEGKHYTIAAYNYITQTYTEIFRKNIGETDAVICNSMLISKETSNLGEITAAYMVNVGYSFIKIKLLASDQIDFIPIEVDEWEMDSKMLESIKGFFVGNLGSTVDIDVKISGIGPWAKYADMYSVAFTSASAYGMSDFVEQTNIVKITLSKTAAQDGTVYRNIQAKVLDKSIQTTVAGTVLAADVDLDNCIFIKNIAAEKITFVKCDQRGSVEFDVKKNQSDELISFSVVNDRNKKNASLLELVYADRLEYLSLGTDTSNPSSAAFGATLLASFTFDNSVQITASDDMPSIVYDSATNTVTLASNKYGLKRLVNTNVYDKDGVEVIGTKTTVETLDDTFSACLAVPYGSNLLVLGFDGFQFDRINGYYDPKGNYIKIRETKEYYTLAQLPYANVTIQ